MSALKLAGALMIAACGFVLGQRLKAGEKRHADFVSGMALSLKRIVSEISFLHTPPLEIFLALAKGGRPEAWFYAEVAAHSRRVRGTVAEAWTAAADRAAREFSLSEGERLELMRAGEVFGRFDLDGTIAQLSAAAERFGELAAAAAAKAAKDGKVVSTVCAASGILVAILLL